MSDLNVKENSDNDVPLTKKINKKEKVINESINEPIKQIKQKKPRSDKQKAQFETVAKIRKENIEKKRLEQKLEASRFLLEYDNKVKQETPLTPHIKDEVKPIKVKKEPKIIEVDNSDDDSEESVIIIKKKAKKPKKKKIIIEEASDSDSSDGTPPMHLHKPNREFITQQNKKSVIKVHKQQQPNYNNYFV